MATQHHTEYASPVLRAPSPASSVGTAYEPDETSLSDSELSQTDFERKCLERLQLGEPRPEERRAGQEPLIPRPAEGSPEEKLLYDQVMYRLRNEVQKLEENELFEQTLLRGSQAALEQQPSTADIDTLMQSMMVAPSSSKQGPKQRNTVADPWAVATNGHRPRYEDAVDVSLLTTGVKAGKRSRNGSSRNP